MNYPALKGRGIPYGASSFSGGNTPPLKEKTPLSLPESDRVLKRKLSKLYLLFHNKIIYCRVKL
jgi:hypothetical protein